MVSTSIRALDKRTIPSSEEEIWATLSNVEAYNRWWPWYLGVHVLSKNQETLGTEVEICPFGGRPFQFRIEQIEPMGRLLLRYFGSFISGYAEWRVEHADGKISVCFKLDVEAHGWPIVLLGKICNLSWIHSLSMHHVLRNLQRELAHKHCS